MSRPLEVTNVYVRVRVHEEARLRYDVDPLLSAAELQRDPNALLQAGRTYLERRVSSAIDPDAAIRKYKRCVIVGDPGAGKTTLLKFLALKAADNALKDLPDLPVHVELSAFAGSEYQDLLDFAAYVWDERYAFIKADARAYMGEMLKAGKALLLLDALDETVIGEKPEVAEASYQRVSEAIIRVATRYPDAPMVVTARKAGYQQRAPLIGFTELEVIDFRPGDIEQFVTKWFACYHDPQKDANAVDLNGRLARTPRIQALAANPLLLSLIVLVYEAQLDLPDRRAELYKRCVEVLLSAWDARRNIRRRREFKPEHKKQLLTELAWHFHQQGRRYMPEHEVLAQIAHFLPAVNLLAEQNGRVLAEIANENGLLKEQAHGWYGFLHLTLQEYFVAQYANDHNELATLLTHLGDPWWEEVLLLYAGQISDASPLFEQLLGTATTKSVQDDLFHTNLMAAGSCLAASPLLRQVSFREEIITRLFDLLTSTPYSLTQKHAADVLAEIGGTAVISRLVRLLADKQVDADVRRSIADALGTLRERSVIPDLLRLLADEQVDESVRKSIADALGTLGERSVIPDLLRLLADEQVDGSVRWRIAVALGMLGEHSVIPDLMRLLADEQVNEYVRLIITEALRTLGEHSVIPDLMRLLADEQVNEYVRENIAHALGMLGERSVIPDLMRLLADEQVGQFVRKSIVFSIERFANDETTAHSLATLLLQGTNVADAVYEALWAVSRRAGVRVFIKDGAKGKEIEIVHWGDIEGRAD
jgi:HEAT repeat protein